jgi:hypothetical protein
MAQLQDSDLLIVGRGGESYRVLFSDVRESVGGNKLPDLTNSNHQAGTTDERYVNINGDTMTSRLDIVMPTDGPAALRIKGGFAMKRAGEDINGENLFYSASASNIVSYTGEITEDEHITNKKYVDDAASAVSGDLSALTATVSDLSGDVSTNAADIVTEITRATAAESSLSDDVSAEVTRATTAEGVLDQKIDDLILDNLADVVVGGATNNQVLSYDGVNDQWVAREVVLSSNLDYAGDTNLTDAPPVGPTEGQLLVNTTTTGSVAAGWGARVQASLPNGVAGGEFVAYNGNEWVYVGAIGGGLQYSSFDVNNVVETTGSKGELAYNNANGTFTFTKVDLDSRIPKNLGDLPVLPA